jgi:hydrogenase accessory protein HypB
MCPPDTGVAVLAGDVQTDNDVKRLAEHGVPVRQITTGGSCYLDAPMVERQLESWELETLDYLFTENVGNLVCPSSYDLGEHDKIVILSVTEREDKPLEYPGSFSRAGLVISNKIDLLPYIQFDIAQSEGERSLGQPRRKLGSVVCRLEKKDGGLRAGTVHSGSKLTVCSTRAGADSSGPQLGHRRVGFH